MKEFDLIYVGFTTFSSMKYAFIFFSKDPLAVSLIELIIFWAGNLTHDVPLIHT